MADRGALLLAQSLIRETSVNPPGNEEACARLVASMLEPAGFAVRLHRFGDHRVNLLAELAGHDPDRAPLVLTGHLDTVPLGDAAWADDPFGGNISGGRLFGRGASDMKSGIAAMTVAAIETARQRHARGIRLIFTGGEETGCEGALALRETASLGAASGIVVGEPTANRMALGHKGCLCLRVTATGVTAHSSMPHLGRNAVYRAAEAVLAVRDFQLAGRVSSALGEPTLNVGTIAGGLNFNSVPDHAAFTVDMRTTDDTPHDDLLALLGEAVGSDIVLERLVDMPPVLTPESDPFVAVVAAAIETVSGEGTGICRAPMPFFTDASVMLPRMQAPCVILGPGEPDCAHQTDEWCDISRITEAVAIYERIIADWCG